MFFIACTNKTKPETDNEYSKQEQIDSIISVNTYLTSFVDAIYGAIDSVATQEGMLKNLVISDTGVQISKEEVLKEINFLQAVINQQKTKISDLENQLKNNKSASAKKIQAIIDNYKKQLEEKEAQIAELEEQIREKDLNIQSLMTNINSLSESLKGKEELIETQSNLINEGYVIAGTKKELQEWGLLTKSGLFKKTKLNISNIIPENFNKVDIREFTSFPISGKSPKVLSQMHPDSYSLDKTGKNEYVLNITNPALFWSITRYLVIQYN